MARVSRSRKLWGGSSPIVSWAFLLAQDTVWDITPVDGSRTIVKIEVGFKPLAENSTIGMDSNK
jgi:hypothetical protein